MRPRPTPCETGSAVTVLLVRHARAGRRDRWKGDDRLRPLSNKGKIQAAALPELLTAWIDRVEPVLLSSPWSRCLGTLGPISHRLGLPVAVDEALGEGMGLKAIDALGGWLARPVAVLCTHGDVVEALLRTVAEGGVSLGRAATAAKGSVWVFEGGRDGIESATYLPPPA